MLEFFYKKILFIIWLKIFFETLLFLSASSLAWVVHVRPLVVAAMLPGVLCEAARPDLVRPGQTWWGIIYIC